MQVRNKKVFESREYQAKVVQDVYGKLSEGFTRIGVVAPTGSGKTVIVGLLLIDLAIKNNFKVLFVVPLETLLNQTIETFEAIGIKPGVIGCGYGEEDRSRHVQITSWQSLQTNDISWFKPDFTVYDEAHVTSFTQSCLAMFPKLTKGDLPQDSGKLIGVTATPWRLSSKEGLRDIYQAFVFAPSPRSLMNMGYLVPRMLYFDCPGSGRLAGNKKILLKEGYVVREWYRLVPGKKTIAFCEDVRSAQALAEAFRIAGVRAIAVSGRTSRKKLQNEIYPFFADESPDSLLVICSCMKVAIGFDATNAEVAIMARQTESFSLYIQMLGRIARMHRYKSGDRKECAYVLDCVGVVQRFGGIGLEDIVYSDRCIDKSNEPDLDEVAPKKSCPECGGYCHVSLAFCPTCQYPFPIAGANLISPGGEMKMAKQSILPEDGFPFEFYKKLVSEGFAAFLKGDASKTTQWATLKYYDRYQDLPLNSWSTAIGHSIPSTPDEVKMFRKYLKLRTSAPSPNAASHTQLCLPLAAFGYNDIIPESVEALGASKEVGLVEDDTF